MPFVEADSPGGGTPGSYQYRSIAYLTDMCDQRGADAVPLPFGEDISVPDQAHVTHRLASHHAHHDPIDRTAGKQNAVGNLRVQLRRRHIRIMPAIVGYHTPINLGRSIDDLQHR